MNTELQNIDQEKLAKQAAQDLAIQKELFKEYDIELKVGDLIRNHYGAWPVLRIFYSKEKNYNTDKKDIMIEFEYEFSYSGETKKSKNKTRISARDLERGSSDSTYKLMAPSVEELDKDVLSLIDETETLESLLDRRLGISTKASDSTAVMVQNKDVIVDKKAEMIKKRDFVLSRMNRMQEILDNKRRALYAIKDQMMAQIERMNKLILSLEIFLGIKEDIYQYQAGNSAPVADPICFRQRVLYMDVECGDPSDQGIDFQNVQDFVDWMLKKNTYWGKFNYEILVPESKCVCVFRIRKDDKNYGTNNPFIEALFNKDNKKTFLFMRNGENIYMVDSELINLGERLFPRKDELMSMVEKGDEISDYDKKKIENKIFDYKLNVILMQGLIERTDIYPEYKYNVNLFNPATHDSGQIRFIYDDDESMQLPSGMDTFPEWRDKLNSTIDEGNRVFLISSLCGSSRDYSRDRKYETWIEERLFRQESKTWNEWRNIPCNPESGLYQVFKFKDHKHYERYSNKETISDVLYIKYNPKDTVVSWDRDKWNEIRKNNLSFKIFNNDSFIINYDALTNVSLKQLEFYMYTRIGREEYLSYIPMLMEIYKYKKAELALEDAFIDLVLNNMRWENNKLNLVKVKKEVKWWKLKNKWKRALNVDDAKALRMIEQKLKRIYK